LSSSLVHHGLASEAALHGSARAYALSSTTNLTRTLFPDEIGIVAKSKRTSGLSFCFGFQNQYQVMKTNITLNGRPLFRGLFVFLIACTALFAMARRASAQLYVAQETGVVSEYDATTGKVIKASFITGLTGTNELALSGDDLFVANTGAPGSGGWVGKYDAKTGAAISQSFITGTNFIPVALALTGSDLFVANGEEGSVGKYDAKTGKAINAGLIAGLPTGELGIGSLGDDLFVAISGDSTLAKFSALTGKSLGAIPVPEPYGLAFLNGIMFVGSTNPYVIGEYSAKTGKTINASFITGLSLPTQIALLGDKLFVANASAGTVGVYNATTGKVINAALISGLSDPLGVAVRK
jgi:DNA-binding beta-propeller fold protein YncE